MKNINEIKGTLLSNKQMKDLKGGYSIQYYCCWGSKSEPYRCVSSGIGNCSQYPSYCGSRNPGSTCMHN